MANVDSISRFDARKSAVEFGKNFFTGSWVTLGYLVFSNILGQGADFALESVGVSDDVSTKFGVALGIVAFLAVIGTAVRSGYKND